MGPEVSLTAIITKQARHAKWSFRLSLFLEDLRLSILSCVYLKSACSGMCLTPYGYASLKKNFPTFSLLQDGLALETALVLLLIAPATCNNSSSSCLFLGCVNSAELSAVRKKV